MLSLKRFYIECAYYILVSEHITPEPLASPTSVSSCSSSFMCGLAGALASNPVDVVRTRMMNQRVLSGNPMYKGTLDGLMQTWKNEGFFALYKGFWPNWLRLGPWNIIVSFPSLESKFKPTVLPALLSK